MMVYVDEKLFTKGKKKLSIEFLFLEKWFIKYNAQQRQKYGLLFIWHTQLKAREAQKFQMTEGVSIWQSNQGNTLFSET